MRGWRRRSPSACTRCQRRRCRSGPCSSPRAQCGDEARHRGWPRGWGAQMPGGRCLLPLRRRRSDVWRMRQALAWC
jgi:hypothetical protein